MVGSKQLFVSQAGTWIGARGAPCGDIAHEQRRGEKQQGDGNQREWILRVDFI
jgi:hypothetical protein